jgi:hypothetical protein
MQPVELSQMSTPVFRIMTPHYATLRQVKIAWRGVNQLKFGCVAQAFKQQLSKIFVRK